MLSAKWWPFYSGLKVLDQGDGKTLMAYFSKEANPSLDKLPLNSSVGLAKPGLTH